MAHRIAFILKRVNFSRVDEWVRADIDVWELHDDNERMLLEFRKSETRNITSEVNK